MDDIDRIKEAVTVPQLWQMFGYGPEPKLTVHHSPFRDDSNKSFSIYDGGHRWKDHATDDGGTVIDFYMRHAQLPDSDEGLRSAIDGLLALLDLKPADPGAYQPLRKPRSKNPHRQQKLADRSPAPKSEHQLPYPEFRRQALRKFQEEVDTNSRFFSELNEFTNRKGLDHRVVYQQYLAGLLGSWSGKLVYLYENGAKRRGSWDTSHNDHWVYGQARGNLWRSELLERPEITSVYLSEGETDCLHIIGTRWDLPNTAECGIPGASWTPDPVMAWKIGQDRAVYLCMDLDLPNPKTGKRAGQESMYRVAQAIKENCTRTTIMGFSWALAIEKGFVPAGGRADMCDLPKEFMQNVFDDCFKEL